MDTPDSAHPSLVLVRAMRANRLWQRQHVVRRGGVKSEVQQGAPQNLDYGNLPTPVKEAVKAALLVEQGYLCAYTLQRLAVASDCHIEHVEPPNAAPDKSLDYANMAACWPDNGGSVTRGCSCAMTGCANCGVARPRRGDWCCRHAGCAVGGT